MKKVVKLNAVAILRTGLLTFRKANEDEADFIAIPTDDYFRMLDELGANAVVLNTSVGGAFNTQCPECGFVAEGFESEEEAAEWVCECSPQLPLEI